MTRALVTGWFSFERMGATAGDLLVRDVVCGWLERAGLPHDVAVAPPFRDGVSLATVDPGGYTHLLFVCGPFGNDERTGGLLERFAHCRRIGVNLSMLHDLEEWNPFDVLFARDGSRGAAPDVTFAARAPAVPVAGLVLVAPQKEYRKRGRHEEANAALREVLAAREAAAVTIDTRLDANATGLRSPREVESLIARMDVVLTTRLHGLVLALKNGVPALAVDPIGGGAKIAEQARVLGWPRLFLPERLDPDGLLCAFDWCLTEEARRMARGCAERGRRAVEDTERRFLAEVRGSEARL
ncbi:MAG TPA: polysaccharide pyruvyl transferase family protein [Planctomycetota bacterium]|nr:polysaccharide pyruvyl transferase family protein [Planctomycetota bacterium]